MSYAERYVLPEELASAAYSVVVEECGAMEIERASWLAYAAEASGFPKEFRCCQSLGFGGKLRFNHRGLYVDCYPEDETPKRLDAMNRANRRLFELVNEYARRAEKG
jgi:hypothetical protein